MFQGTYTAIVTPFQNGELDYARLDANIQFQVDHGIDGVVPCGTTGESPTLSHDEHRGVVEHVVQTMAGRGKVIAGTGSNATSEAIELTRHAAKAGADGALMVSPYYNKPTQEGLLRHFMTVADAVDLPIVLYNIPGRTGVAIEPTTMARLAGHENIVGVKEATGSTDNASEIAAACDAQRFIILSGDDSMTLPLMALGGTGVISVLSNLMPQRIKALTDAAAAGDFAQARTHHLDLFPLFNAMLSLATNPIPIKTALALTGQDTGELRLPMAEMGEASAAKLERLLVDSGALQKAQA